MISIETERERSREGCGENSSNCKNNNNICEDRKAIELNDGVIRHKERIRKDVMKGQRRARPNGINGH